MGLIKSVIKAPFKIAGFAIKAPFKILKGTRKGIEAINDSLKKIDNTVSRPVRFTRNVGLGCLFGFLLPTKRKSNK